MIKTFFSNFQILKNFKNFQIFRIKKENLSEGQSSSDYEFVKLIIRLTGSLLSTSWPAMLT